MLEVVVGLQYGDEGKGRAFDYLCSNEYYSYLVRANGGNNSGRTVCVDGETYIFNYLCSGVLNEDKYGQMLLCNGMVIHPVKLVEEITRYEQFNILNKLKISDRIHLVLEEHVEKDSKDSKIGTTKQGIGPCMEDKISRKGIRFQDIIKNIDLLKNQSDEYIKAIKYLIEKELICENVEEDLQLVVMHQGNKSLLEIVQGTMLDIDLGYYPFVTSTRTCVPGVLSTLGIQQKDVSRVIGVFKAYCTRVGNGPLLTAIVDEQSSKEILEIGNEFGTVTNRPRRIGWLNIPELLYAIKINNCTDLFMTKIDVLEKIVESKIAISYNNNGVFSSEFSFSYDKIEPYYINIENVNNFRDFYVETVSQLIQRRIDFISFGSDRNSLTIR